MNQKMVIITFSLFALFVIGCTKNNEDRGFSNKVDEGEVIVPTTSQSTVPNVVSGLKLEGDIKNIYYADEEKVLISADKLYLYDVENGNIVKESKQETFKSENFWVIDSGYVAVRETLRNDSGDSMMMDDGFHINIMFYDHQLNKVSEFDLNQLLDDDDMLMSTHAISFSSTGTQVAYATYSGLYIYDFEKNRKTMVINLESTDAQERSGIVNIEQIGFTNGDKRIAFKAQSFDVPVDLEKPSFDTCGIVNTDGTGLSNRTFDNYFCKELTPYNNLLLFAEDVTVASGRALVMEIVSDQIKIHTLIEKEESGYVAGSDSGRYFATSVSNKAGWTVRVYNTETGKLEAEQQVPSEEDYMAQLPVIKVLDDTKTIIVLLGSKRDDIDTKMMVSQF